MISSRQPELVSGSHYELFNSLMRFRNKFEMTSERRHSIKIK